MGLSIAAAVVGLGAVVSLVLLLSLFLDAWLAALITGIAFAAVATILAISGKERVEEIETPLPQQTLETVKEDVQWVKEQARSGRT